MKAPWNREFRHRHVVGIQVNFLTECRRRQHQQPGYKNECSQAHHLIHGKSGICFSIKEARNMLIMSCRAGECNLKLD